MHLVKPGDLADAAESPGSDLARHLHAFANELDYVYRTLRRYGVRGADAEDVAQEVFLIAWRRRDDFDTSRPLRPWLGGIAFKLAHQYHQRRKPVAVEDIGEDFADAEPTSPPELEPEALDARALVLRVLATLPERYREVLVAHELDGTPVDEIASRWRVPRFTLYTRLRRARLAFAEEVNRIQGAAGKRPVVARSLAPGLLLTMKREEVPGAPPALQRHLLERLRAEALLAGRHLPAGAGALLGLGWKWLAGLGAAALLTGVVVLVATRNKPAPVRQGQARPTATPVARSLPPPRLLPATGTSVDREPPPTVATGLGRDLVGFWRFEDGRGSTRALDHTPGGLASGGRACELRRLDPTQAWVPGAVGGGVELGFNGWLECPQPALPRRSSAAFTVALWVKRAGSPVSHRALVTRAMDEGAGNYFFFGFAGDTLTALSAGRGGRLTAPFREPPGRWVHVAVTHDADGVGKLYIAGREVARQRSPRRMFGATQQPLRVGGGLRSDDRVRVRQLFEGAVDELLVYERALDGQEIATLAGGATP